MELLDVKLAFTPDELISVGQLGSDGGQIYFRYASDFLARGLDLSPIRLPLLPTAQRVETQVFDGLFGVFADSLPGGWGRLLLDRALVARGVDLATVGPLARLAYVGRNGPGALVYEPAVGEENRLTSLPPLDQLADEAAAVLRGEGDTAVEDLLPLGGSSGGARPKILVNYNPISGELRPTFQPLKAGDEPWIIKFSAGTDAFDSGPIEFAYYQMARLAGIEMAPSRLFRGASGRQYFGTKRFDRDGERRLHFHSAAGLMHDNFRYSSMDYGHLIDAAYQLERTAAVKERVLRLAAFNVFAHNRDDHSKNFSFLMDADGRWCFAPAYDLTYSESGHGHQSLTVAREGRLPGRRHLMKLGRHFDIANAGETVDQVRNALEGWLSIAQKVGVGIYMRKVIERVINYS